MGGGSSSCCQHGFTFEFLGAAAADAHHMVMLTVIVNGKLKASPPFTELQFLEQTHVGQQAQGAIHRCQRHLHLKGRQLLVHLFGTEVTAGPTALEQLKNPFALRGQTAPVLMKPLLQGDVRCGRR